MVWRKTCTSIRAMSGDRTIRYVCGEWAIESRRRAIPHANGEGSWLHTTYFLIRPDGTEKEYYSLRDAKEAAEKEATGED